MYHIVSLFMLGCLLNHYEDRLLAAATPQEQAFLHEQVLYYTIRYNNFSHH